MATDLVEPKSATPVEPATPAAEPAESTTPAKASKSGIPDEVLQLPALQAIFSGSPPALSAPIEQFAKRPEAALIQKNLGALQKAGLALYRSLAGDTGVIFNQLKVSPAEIQTADQEGRLQEIAPPFDAVSQQVASSGQNNPVLSAQPATGAATAPVAQPPQAASPIRQPAASAQRAAISAKVKNLSPGGPSSGPKPGAGRLLNSILKPAV